MRLEPGHQRRVDHVRHAVPADRPYGEVHVLEAEAMRGDLLQRKAPGCQLRQRQLAGLVAVAAGALDGHGFDRDALEREVGEFLELALHHDSPGLALHRLDTEEDRDGARAGRAIEHHIDALAAGDLLYARERIFLVHVDRVIGAELLRYREPRAILRRAGDDDERGASLLADHGLRKALLPWPLDQHRG